MNTYKSIKKVMLVGITAMALLSGCGSDTKNDMKQETAKAKEEARAKEEAKKEEAKAKEEQAKKEKEEKGRAELEANKVEVERFDTCNSQGKYCERGMLNRGSFEALKVGMSPREVTKTLRKNAEYARKSKVLDKTGNEVDVIEYTYNATVASVTIDFKDGKLYMANGISNGESLSLDGRDEIDNAQTKPAEEKDEAPTKFTDNPAPSKADTSAKNAKSSIPNDYCGHGHDETKELAHGCDKVIDEEAHQRHLQQQEREYEEQQRKEAKKYQDEMTEEDKARILRQEKRWNTPSGGMGATWQDELKEMEEKEAQENAQQ
ncbi:hypothetical protein [Bacillus cereus]